MDAEPIVPADIPAFEDIRTRIGDFVRRFHPHKQDDDEIFTPDVNSLFAMQLVTFIQDEFAMTLEEEDLMGEHWQTINTIAKFVYNKLLA